MRILSLIFGTVILGGIVFVGMQCYRPALTYPPVTADLQVPPEVKAVLVTSCYDCHSNETKLKWFDYIQPGYSLVVDDVNKGRRHLNFSEIGSKPAAQQKGALYEGVSQIMLGSMPPKKYTLLHRDAVVTPAQLATLTSYLKSLESTAPSTPDEGAAADAQFAAAISPSATHPDVAPEFNGLVFPAGYQDWRQLSSTVRDDNNSLRQILGNDIAIQAVKSGQINPWPDGTMFAKVAWLQQTDANGAIKAGAFEQVEFMVKDSQKYASTRGWGWGRWLGTDLKPFGKDATFTTSCVSCHAPVRDSDFVFTLPLRTQPKETP